MNNVISWLGRSCLIQTFDNLDECDLDEIRQLVSRTSMLKTLLDPEIQTVVGVPRHDMPVKMKHRLLGFFTIGHQQVEARCFVFFGDLFRSFLCRFYEGFQLVQLDIKHISGMLLRDYHDVAIDYRTQIRKSDGVIILVEDLRRSILRCNLAENARFHGASIAKDTQMDALRLTKQCISSLAGEIVLD